MQLRRNGIPSQRYSPNEDYTYDHHHEVIQNNTTRRPLGESTGNAQPQNLAALGLCDQSQLSLSPPLHSIPTPPTLSVQALTSTYATSFRNQRSFYRNASLQEPPMAHSRGSRNPIYSWKYFADYRTKVTQKESENEDPTWPLYLEDAFLDALLLIPLMGRKKFSSKGVLYGRNMLITEYLWICHWILFPAAPGEVIPAGKAREKHPKYGSIFRGRKQVSSHIQVLKAFFLTHPLFHFFFPRKNDERDEERKNLQEDEGDTESFKNNQVLIALAEGRLPDERPNYEYFARLLAGDSEVFVRPRTCWIYVSSCDVVLSDDYKRAIASDGACLEADAYTSDGSRLEGKGDYPHLVLNNNKETKRDLEHNRDGPRNYLLHEYTRTLSQKESSSIREISSKWDQRFPELRDKLVSTLEETHPSHEYTSRCVVGHCDTIHFDVVLDLHATSQFPTGTHLDGVVQLSICRPELANHSWRSVTSVVKPRELENSDDEDRFWNFPKKCELSGQGNKKDTIEVPFPAKSWANTFIRLAKYVSAEREKTERERTTKEESGSRQGSRTRKVGRDDDDRRKPSAKLVTPMDLLKQVAMYQEIWSTPIDGSSDKQRWTRRALILWTFSNVHSKVDDKGKVVTVLPGTNWRFLTKLDPTSGYHQQHAYVSGSPHISMDSVTTSNMGFANHLGAVMRENPKPTYDDPARITLPGQHQQHGSHLANIDLLDGFSNGLATPPSTASLPSNYGHSFDTQTIASTDSLHHNINFLSDGSIDSQGTLVGGDEHHRNTSTDSFLASLGGPYDGQDAFDPNMLAWAADALHGIDSTVAQWGPTTYAEGQLSLAWADHGVAPTGGGSNLADGQWGHKDATSWQDGSDSLWATALTSTSSNGNTAVNTARAGDEWAMTTSHSWLQATGAAAEATDDSGNSSGGGWDDRGHHQSGSSSLRQQQAQGHHDHQNSSGGTLLHDSDIHDVHLSTPPTSTFPLRGVRKRSRAEGDDEDSDEGSKGYPVHSIRKLTHNAPTAAIKEEGQQASFF